MVDTNSKYLYISGLISLSIYVIIVFMIIAYIKMSDIKKIYFQNKQTVIELQFLEYKDIAQPIKKKVISSKKLFKSTKIDTKIIKKSTSRSAKKVANLKSLFAKTSTTSKKLPTQDVLNIKSSVISSRYKSEFEKQRREERKVNVDDIFSDVKVNKISKVLNVTVEKKDNDPYFSKIGTILSNKWRPIANSSKSSAVVLITINNMGDFSYQFLKYSNDEVFNQALEKFLISQLNEKFPIPDKDIVEIKITFTSVNPTE